MNKKTWIARRETFRGMLAGVSMLMAAGQALADDTIKLGYLVDLNGPTAYLTGPGAVEGAKMAIEDFGGSVLGKKIELLVADHQNKPDVGSGIARQWYDAQNVQAIFDLSQSALALSVKDLATQRKRIAIYTSAMSSELTGKQCSPYAMRWGWDSYSTTHPLTNLLIKAGGKRWSYLTVDYTFGRLTEKESQDVVKELGGTILGSSYSPLGTSDFSANLIQIASENPDVIGFANSSSDLVNSLKQSVEFGITAKKALFVFQVLDAEAVGLPNIQGAQFVDQFYWDMNDDTRAFTKRFAARMRRDIVPTGPQANAYGSVMHYLKAVKAAGTTDIDQVVAKMHEMPVDDFYTKGARIRADGQVMRDMYLMEAKKVEDSKSRWDLFRVVQTIPPDQAFQPVDKAGCPLDKIN